jgi:hypothetical protein
MDWRSASRSRSRAPAAMEWRPASHSRSRSRPPLSLSMGGMGMTYQFPPQLGPDTGYNNVPVPGPSSYAARMIRDPSTWIPRTFENDEANETTPSSAINIPNSSSQPSQEQEDGAANGDVRGAEGLGSGPGSGVSLLTRSLQMSKSAQIFSESPPNTGVDFYQSQYAAPGATAVVGPHVTLSQSLRERGINFDPGRRPSIHQQLEQLEQQSQAQREQSAAFMQQAQSEEFVPSSLPAYRHPSGNYDQQSHTTSGEEQWQAGIRTALGSGFPRRVRKTSFDHTASLENAQDDARVRGRHQMDGRSMPPPPESTLVSF